MNIIKNVALILFLTVSLGATAYAEETAKSSVISPNETIMHIEKAKVEIIKNDFMPPSEHLKAARAASEKVTGNPDVVKQANACIIQAQIKVNQGDIKRAIDELDKTLELYKSLQPK